MHTDKLRPFSGKDIKAHLIKMGYVVNDQSVFYTCENCFHQSDLHVGIGELLEQYKPKNSTILSQSQSSLSSVIVPQIRYCHGLYCLYSIILYTIILYNIIYYYIIILFIIILYRAFQAVDSQTINPVITDISTGN